MAQEQGTLGRRAAVNRKARRNYFIDEVTEAGVMLAGSEVKSLRLGQADISEAYATGREGEIFLFNAYIPEYGPSSRFGHEPRRARKLLVRRRERERLLGAVHRHGMTLVPLSIYFNERGIAKIELALARGKKHHDKRETVRERDWQRDKARLLRDKG
jgi:SsrA-binding protein